MEDLSAIIKSREYYYDLIREVDEITNRSKAEVQLKLPPTSIWNTLNLSTVNEGKKRGAPGKTFDLAKDMARIQASVAAAASKRSCSNKFRPINEVVLTPREKLDIS